MASATRRRDPGRLIVAGVGITWVPLLIIALGERILIGRVEPMARDLSVHARFLLAMPVLLLAEPLLDRVCDETLTRLFEEGFVPAAQHERAQDLLARAEAWRRWRVPDALIFGLALVGGVAALFGLLPPAGVLHGIPESPFGPVRCWYALVSLPLFQFLLWRSLFRWAIWVRVLVGLSRLQLQLLPMHADRRGGVGFLKRPSIAYGALLLLAMSCVLCAGWATQMLLYGARIATFKPLFFAFVVVGVLVAFAPLLAFLPMLAAARRRGRRSYGGLVSDYSRRFEERWLGPPASDGRAELLGTPDLQSPADLGTSYRENIERMEVLLFGPRDAVLLFVVSQIPALPIVLMEVPARDVLQRLMHLLVGGMPG